MKKFVTKTIFISLPIIVFLTALEIVLRMIPNDYKLKSTYLNNHSNEIESLILGSSHSVYGLNPEFFKTNTYNASHVSQSLDLDFKILKKYEDNFSNLKTIYLPISYYTLWFKLGASNESWRTRSYIDSYDFTDGIPFSDYLKITGNFKQNINKAKSFLFRNKSSITISEKGWGTIYNSKNAKDLEETGVSAAERHSKNIESDQNKDLFEDNLESLQQIINWCEIKNINLVLFTPPAFKSYRDKLEKGQLETTIRLLQDKDRQFGNLIYHNYMADPNFIKEDYYDADHLSEIGAEKLSKAIQKYGN